ncbi:hypothetical protein CCP3SC15_2320002 [Gammaproteobacteria bacterium]
MSDILVQRVLRLIDQLDLETPGTIRDRIDHAEKKGLTVSAERLAEARLLRNTISHEYLPNAFLATARMAIDLTPDLLNSVERIQAYCRRYTEGN